MRVSTLINTVLLEQWEHQMAEDNVSSVVWGFFAFVFGSLIGVTVVFALDFAMPHTGTELPPLATWFIGPAGGAAGAARFAANASISVPGCLPPSTGPCGPRNAAIARSPAARGGGGRPLPGFGNGSTRPPAGGSPLAGGQSLAPAGRSPGCSAAGSARSPASLGAPA